MRLICTRCNAQYEIEAALLPDSGREVQCSSCGHVWFQEKDPRPKPEPVATTPPAPPAPLPEPAQEPEPAYEQDIPDAHPGTPPSPRKVDEKVLEILREEAEFEARQRAQEAGTLETQTELGLTAAAPWPSGADRKAKIPSAVLRDETPKATPSAFPDIEDISASLEPIGNSRMGRNTAGFDLPAPEAERKNRFWTGLAVPVVLGAILVIPYLMAPEIIDALPAAEPALTSYVNVVNEMRIRLADLVNG